MVQTAQQTVYKSGQGASADIFETVVLMFIIIWFLQTQYLQVKQFSDL